MGFPFFTGSEENRGPLYDETHVNHEGDRLPFDNGPQGDKIPGVGPPVADFPSAVPLMAACMRAPPNCSGSAFSPMAAFTSAGPAR